MSGTSVDHERVRKAIERLLRAAEDAGYGEYFSSTIAVMVDAAGRWREQDDLRMPLFPGGILGVAEVFAAVEQPERPLHGVRHFRIPDRS